MSIIIAVEPVGLVGDREYAVPRGLALRRRCSGRFESGGQPCCQLLLNGPVQAAPVFDKSTGQKERRVDGYVMKFTIILLC